jgi:6,7-dimethyl-8-ribityllumazine synthase
MPTVIEGQLTAAGLRFAIVASRFNGLIVEPLIAGAVDAITRTGGAPDASRSCAAPARSSCRRWCGGWWRAAASTR